MPGIIIPESMTSEQDNEILRNHLPDVNHPHTGILTSTKAFKLFKETQKNYAKARSNWEHSGQHSNSPPFCQGNIDLLVFHLWLHSIGDPSLTKFASEGQKIVGGFYSGLPNATETIPNSIQNQWYVRNLIQLQISLQN